MRGIYIDRQVDWATGGTQDHYVVVPYECTVRTALATCDADPGDGDTITIAYGATTIGVVTFGSSIAAGATGTYAVDASGKDTRVPAGGVLKITMSQSDAAVAGYLSIQLDEYGCTSTSYGG